MARPTRLPRRRSGNSAPKSIAIGVTPNGKNINDHCGSTHLDLIKETVVASGADIGIALDGDADRLIVVDEQGETVDGDQIMALIGCQHGGARQAARRRGCGDGDVQPRARTASSMPMASS